MMSQHKNESRSANVGVKLNSCIQNATDRNISELEFEMEFNALVNNIKVMLS